MAHIFLIQDLFQGWFNVLEGRGLPLKTLALNSYLIIWQMTWASLSPNMPVCQSHASSFYADTRENVFNTELEEEKRSHPIWLIWAYLFSPPTGKK